MKRLFAITLGLAALVACNKKAAETVTPATPIRFAVSGEYTFTKATEAALENDDQIQIIAGAPISAATKATVSNNTELTLTTPLYWGAGQTAATDFVALYPYTSATATTVDYDLSNGDYDYHKLYMTAHVSAAPAGGNVVLPFKHPFSKVILNITNNLGSDDVVSVVVKGLKLAATLDLVAGTVDFGNAAAADVTATELATNSYGVIVMPQEGQPTIEVTTYLGSVYTFALSSAFTFEAGKVATAALTLEGQGGSGQTQGDAVTFGFSVTDWTASDTAPAIGADPTVAMGSYWYITGCVYDDDDTVAPWSKDFPMTYKGKDNDNKEIWEITINCKDAMAGDVEGSKGFKFRRYSSTTADEQKWDTQLGMWSNDTNTYIDLTWNDYGLATATDGNKNIRFEDAGNYKLTLTGNTLTFVKN